MGTMIQELKLDEEGYRGARFDAWNREVRGNNDLLILTQPDAVRDIHLAYFRAGADIVSTNTFSSTTIAQADYGMEDIAYELNRRRREARARGAADIAQSRGRPPALRRRRARADQPHRLDLARRVQSGLPRHHLRRVARRLWRADQRGLIDGGADLLLIETIFDTLNAKAAIYAIAEMTEARGVRVPVMISGTITDRSGPAAVRARRRRRSGIRCATPRRSRSGSTARSAPRRCAPISPRSRASPTRWCAPIRMPGCPTSSAATTRARNTWPS